MFYLIILSEEVIKQYITEANEKSEMRKLPPQENEIDTHFKSFLKTEMLSNSMKPLVPKRLYNEELSRAIYLNYLNPEKYNLKFFSEYFDIEPRKLMDVFDTVSYPMINRANHTVIRIYRFVYV